MRQSDHLLLLLNVLCTGICITKRKGYPQVGWVSTGVFLGVQVELQARVVCLFGVLFGVLL
jgi:hypothetical protein